MLIPGELKAAADDVIEGKMRQTTPRILTSLFGARRRGHWVVRGIRETMAHLGITTDPDFEYAWIDEEIAIVRALPTAVVSTTATTAVPAVNTAAPPATTTTAPSDPTYRIGKLEAANRPPVSVAPEEPLTKAVTLMMVNDFSQLPIMQGERNLKGLISWESIAQTIHLGKACTKVGECATSAQEISSDTSLFEAISFITKHGYVLIRGRDQRISGIVTATDLGVQLGKLGEPFLLLGELENHLRRVIETRFTLEQLRSVKDPADPRVVNGVDDLTFGEYIRLLENPTNWTLLGLPLERAEFVKGLQAVREIRNDVMHFDPDGPGDDELRTLRRWVGLFQRLATLRVL